MGSVFSVASSFSRLSEKRDQSSAPKVTLNENGKPVLRGSHNIMRTVLEFAIDERDSVAVYLGTPAEIVSTLYWLGSSAASNSAEEHNREIGDLPYIQRFGLCADASALAKLANDFSLPMSDRTAYRILKYEIKPLELHLQLMLGEQGSSSSAKEKPERKEHPIRLFISREEDLDAFCKQVMADYAQLSRSYYWTRMSKLPFVALGENWLCVFRSSAMNNGAFAYFVYRDRFTGGAIRRNGLLFSFRRLPVR